MFFSFLFFWEGKFSNFLFCGFYFSFFFHNRGVQWDTPMSKWADEGEDWIQLLAQRPLPQGRRADEFAEDDDTADGEKDQERGGAMTKKPRDLEPLALEMPPEDKKPMPEFRGDSKTIVDWVNGHAKLKTKESTIAIVQNLLREWRGRGVNLRVTDRAVHIFRERNKEARLVGWGKASKVVKNGGWTQGMLPGLKLPACVVSGTVVVKVVSVVLVLRSRLSQNPWDGLRFTKSAARPGCRTGWAVVC